MRRYEVAVRSNAPVTAPRTLCSACGRRPEHAEIFGRRYTPFEDSKVATLERAEFPLCDACADALPLRRHFEHGGALLAFLLVLIVYLAYGWDRSTESVGRALAELVVPVGLGVGTGVLLGRGASSLVGMAIPRVRTSNRVVGSVGVEFDGWRAGRDLAEHRAFFRFTSEEYARAFADANAHILLPGRGRNTVSLPAPESARPAATEAARREH